MTATVERIQLIAQGRGEAIRVCTGALCGECQYRMPPIEIRPGRWEHRPFDVTFGCPASALWTAIKAAGWA